MTGLTIKQLSERFNIPLPTMYNAIGTERFPIRPVSINPQKWSEDQIESWEKTNPPFLRRTRVIDGFRQCAKCDNWEPLEGYSPKGFTCMNCKDIPKKKYEIRNADEQRMRRKTWRNKYYATPLGRACSICNSIRARSKVGEGLETAIKAKLLVGVCEITGLPFDLTSGENRKAFGPSIDRIDNNGLYDLNNIQLICMMANIGKNQWEQIDFIAMCVAVAERHAGDPAVIQRLKELRNAEF